MLQRLVCHIAGVDHETLSTCPPTDKLWVAHLGFSLTLSFIVVLAITFHATGYVITNGWMRFAAAAVVATTVFLFDRALYQSDWFFQGVFSPSSGGDSLDGPSSAWLAVRRFLRIAGRLLISFGLAWVIAVFLELAIFSDTITDKLKRDQLAANQGIYQKVERYEAQLDSEIEERRSQLAAAEAAYQRELANTVPAEAATPSQFDGYEQQIRVLDSREQNLRSELRQIEQKIATYGEDMNAEELGRRINPNNSGRAGSGPRFQFAKRQKELYEEQRADRERELKELQANRGDVRAAQTRLVAETRERGTQDRASFQSRRDAVRAHVDAARAELQQLQASRIDKVDETWRQIFAGSEFQKQRDDPLSRMTAYQELKNDPKDGTTITLFSWMTKFVVIFLEIVPVVAKMFFSPPSVYAARIRAEIERGREQVRLEGQKWAAEMVQERTAQLVEYPMRDLEQLTKDASAPKARAGGGRRPHWAHPSD